MAVVTQCGMYSLTRQAKLRMATQATWQVVFHFFEIKFSNSFLWLPFTSDDSYHRYQEDIDILKNMGLNSYRFSIAWSRIFPDGDGEINQAGVDHYNKVIDALVKADIVPFATLFHWDTPLALEARYGGWLSPEIEQSFVKYADACFAAFGDRVKNWLTLNEPMTVALVGYSAGVHAPGRCSDRTLCAQGNSTTEPYIVAHNMLNSHAAVVQLYRAKYQQAQVGQH